MNSRDFVFWLQGMFELNPDLDKFNKVQVEQIRAHLQYVFDHEIFPKEIKVPETKVDWLDQMGKLPPGRITTAVC